VSFLLSLTAILPHVVVVALRWVVKVLIRIFAQKKFFLVLFWSELELILFWIGCLL
jgi:hypothetical protein